MDFRQTQQAIEQALTKIKTGTVKALAIEWRKSITKNFDSKGRPAWPARKRISKRQRGTNILVISGAMKNVSTVPNIAQLSVTLTVDPRAKAYAKIHNEGGKINMPARELKFRKNRQGRTVFASAQAKKVAKTTTSAAYTIVIPKREYTNIPREDFPRIVEAIKQQIKL